MTADERAHIIATHMRAHEGDHVGAGLTLLEAREGYARVTLTATPAMLNSHQTLHGGVIFTLADTAFAYACNSRNQAAVAQQVSIIFLAPAQAGETLTAEAVEHALQGRSGIYHVTVTGAAGRTIATFQGLARLIGQTVLPPETLDQKKID